MAIPPPIQPGSLSDLETVPCGYAPLTAGRELGTAVDKSGVNGVKPSPVNRARQRRGEEI